VQPTISSYELHHQAVTERLHALRQEAALARAVRASKAPPQASVFARLLSHFKRSDSKPETQEPEAQTIKARAT
jgi:hypothetical protein